MEIKPSEGLQIKYKDKVLSIVRPKVGYLKLFKKRLRDVNKEGAEDTDIDVMYDYCLHVGVPQDVVDEWDLKEMTQLFNYLSDDEKKS